jgi:hypothetical protein
MLMPGCPRAAAPVLSCASTPRARRSARAMQARRALFGEGAALTPDRFLFGNVGEVHLIRWSPEHGHRVRCARRAAVGALAIQAASLPPHITACCCCCSGPEKNQAKRMCGLWGVSYCMLSFRAK